MSKFVDLSGRKFGRWAVLRRDVETIKNCGRRPNYICECECGAIRSVPRQSLTKGDSRSCGCLHKEIMSARGLKDLTGKTFGRLFVVGRDNTYQPKKKYGGSGVSAKWICKCECGKIKSVKSYSLTAGITVSCGCYQRDLVSKNGRYADINAGQIFGRWTVAEKTIASLTVTDKSGSWWICHCECGVVKTVRDCSLKDGSSKSCGCLQIEHARSGDSNRKHGETGTRLYTIWAGMKARCYDENQTCYFNYGGRGIQVCDEWLNDYPVFRDWALSNGYADNLTIERNNVNGNYCPENCSFITHAAQARNKRNAWWITAWGETKRADEWIEDPRCKLENLNSLKTRLKRGIVPEIAISTPVLRVIENPNTPSVEAWGETKLLTEWAKDSRCKVEYVTLKYRVNAGWIPARAIATPPIKPVFDFQKEDQRKYHREHARKYRERNKSRQINKNNFDSNDRVTVDS